MNTLKIFQSLSKYPAGKWLYGKLIGYIAPYFSTIKPYITELKPGKAKIIIKDRRKIRNHFGSIHAGALCNLAELAGGLTIDVSLSPQLKWIPIGMSIQYLKKARGHLAAVCEVNPSELLPGRVSAKIEILNMEKEKIAEATIDFNIKEKSNTQ